tara:strand:+ start:8680 stop:9513 length:834 start_codon:yes stop_codon:yes gene_type:complete
MGLGGYLMWTAVAREIYKASGGVKCLPIESHGAFIKSIKSEIFDNNPHFLQSGDAFEIACPLCLNHPDTNYCKKDTPEKAYHRYDKHVISQICEFYGIENPDLKCQIFLRKEEKIPAMKLKEKLGKFVTIEPHSKLEYTPNRAYSFQKWQVIVDALCDKINFIQVGLENRRCLENVTDVRGTTTFREAAGILQESELFISTEGGLAHAANAVDTKSLVIMTGYQDNKMVCYPQNINIDISSHGPCGLKGVCQDCERDVNNHNPEEIINVLKEVLEIE